MVEWQRGLRCPSTACNTHSTVRDDEQKTSKKSCTSRCRPKEEERGRKSASEMKQWSGWKKCVCWVSKALAADTVTASCPPCPPLSRPRHPPLSWCHSAGTARFCMIPRYFRGPCEPWWAKEIKARRCGPVIGRTGA
ncbi:hypothetical protein J3E68DRAFT_391757 [Trichoderma sp. SZMC 28012]